MSYNPWVVVFGEQPSQQKWQILGDNDAHFYSFLGDNLAWVSWTPTWTNITVGDGTVNAKYTRVGNTVHFRILFTLGSTSSVGTSPVFTLPVTSVSPVIANASIGTGQLTDTGVTTYPCLTIHNSTTQGAAIAVDANSTFTRQTGVTSSVPHSWGSGDTYYVEGKYEAA